MFQDRLKYDHRDHSLDTHHSTDSLCAGFSTKNDFASHWLKEAWIIVNIYKVIDGCVRNFLHQQNSKAT